MPPHQHCVCLRVVLDCLAHAVCELALACCVLNDGHHAVAIKAMALNALQPHMQALMISEQPRQLKVLGLLRSDCSLLMQAYESVSVHASIQPGCLTQSAAVMSGVMLRLGQLHSSSYLTILRNTLSS
jgi:hypothetical protein